MIGLIQRTTSSEVWVDNECVSNIGRGVLLLAGIETDDTEQDARWLAGKTVNLRLFGDNEGNLNLSLLDIKGEILVVSQFTLLGDTRKGRRPSFTRAAQPQVAEGLYKLLIKELRSYDLVVKEGIFGAMMDVKLTNSGPVTLIINSKEKTNR
ncbi:MAG: D-tyrosyl-tRNA(Tyr) deacylase [Spirochaetota bacterium]|nr:MAG: D-tyrosyl-tRNA(Tyr) deacylase [Spirochaetota bacterium]